MFTSIRKGLQGLQSSSYGAFRRQGSPQTPTVVSDGLVLHFDFGNGRCYSGTGTSATDLSSTGAIGTLSNGPGFSSVNGGVLDFDGTNDYFSVPSNAVFPTGSTARTVSLWFNNPASSWVTDINPLFFSGAQSNGNAFGIDFDTYPAIQVYTWGGAGYDLLINTKTLPADGWKNLVVCYNGNKTVTLYENGVMGNTGTLTNTPNTSANPVYLGTLQPSYPQYFIGQIGMFSYYNRQLSDAEIWLNFDSNRARYGI